MHNTLLLALVTLLPLPMSLQEPALKRTPTFDFSPQGPISDADLANYSVALTCSVAGEDVGTVQLVFWPEKAPRTVRNFLRYCDEGFYDGLTFHRILREFMVQGGDPTGTGAGDGPYGDIPGEFSDDPKYAHGYGVISMARGQSPDSASCQFFIVCDETPSVWNLDGKYASFGKMVGGVDALEAMANVETGGPQDSDPKVKVVIEKAVVSQGKPESTEKIERPAPDLKGQPARITVQHVLISFAGTGTDATRTQDAAKLLADEVLKRALAGEDFTTLVREMSDDPSRPDDPSPGTYTMLNQGVRDAAGDRAMFQANKVLQAYFDELRSEIGAGKLKPEEAQAKLEAKQEELRKELFAAGQPPTPRGNMVKSFGDVGFSLGVGAIGMAAYDKVDSKFGYHIIKRIQ